MTMTNGDTKNCCNAKKMMTRKTKNRTSSACIIPYACKSTRLTP